MRDKVQMNRKQKQTGQTARAAGTETSNLELAEAKRAVLSHGWLADQDSDFQAALLDKASLRRFSAGSPVYDVGDFRGGFFGVAAGAVGVKVPQRDGEARLAHIARTLTDAAINSNVYSSACGQKRDKNNLRFAKGLWHQIFQ